MLRVQYDDQVFTWQPRGGISRYFVELLKAFRDPRYGVSGATDATWTQNQHLLEMRHGRRLPGPAGRRKEVLHLANRLNHPRAPQRDIVHHTYYDRRYLRQVPFRVVTVYDMIPELFPDMFPRGNPHRDKRAFVEAADLILCISLATRRDLEAVYGAVAAPVVVTPLGVDPGFWSRAERSAELPDAYVLFVGDRAGYKDFWVLATAFATAALPSEIRLLAVGGGPLAAQESARLRKMGLEGRVTHLQLDDRGLASAYAQALAFVFPSRYEGFGLPTLEAMSSGCPTILSSQSSHPEVGGEAALYFPPGDDAELAQLLERVAGDLVLRAELGRLAVARARNFSWAETARRTAAAYREHVRSGR